MDNDQSESTLDVVGYFSYRRITVYQNPTNLGLWGNMTRILELARGEWILILCDDDFLMPSAIRMFERVLSSHRDQDIGCIAGGVELLLADDIKPLFNTKRSRIQFPLAKSLYSKDSLRRIEDDMKLLAVPKLCSSFFRREYIQELGWDAECHGFADLALFLKIQREKKLFTCMQIFGVFRVHDANESNPRKLWNTYPISAARRLLSYYVDEKTQIGKGIRNMIERTYTSSLWKGRFTPEIHRTYAKELLQLNIRSRSRRLFLKNIWLLRILGWVYTELRPMLGWASRVIVSGE